MPFINGIGPFELVIILVIALIVVGPGRLPDVGAALGKSIREFRKAATDVKDATSLEPDRPSAPAVSPAVQPQVQAAVAPPPAPPVVPAPVALVDAVAPLDEPAGAVAEAAPAADIADMPEPLPADELPKATA